MHETPWNQSRTHVSEQDGELIQRAQEGQRAAFEALVQAHYPRIFATAFHLMANHEDAEDLAQDCFVRAQRGLTHFRGESNFPAWLRRILVHLAHDRFRALGRRPQPGELDTESLAGKRPGPPERSGTKELKLLMTRAVEVLPDHLRIAFVLRTQESLTYGEISAACGVTEATARTQVMKARKALHNALKPYLERKEA
jgi:RNA polymerase sigma-70 factor (ECF subfamily)